MVNTTREIATTADMRVAQHEQERGIRQLNLRWIDVDAADRGQPLCSPNRSLVCR